MQGRSWLRVILLGAIILFLGSSYSALPQETVHEGDLVIEGDQVFTIENVTYHQRGNIIVRDNAQLIIRNATLVMEMDFANQYQIRVYGNAHAVITDTSIESTSTGYFAMIAGNSANVSLTRVRAVSFSVHCWGDATVNVEDSTLNEFGVDGNVTVSLLRTSLSGPINLFFGGQDRVILNSLAPGHYDNWSLKSDETNQIGFDLTLEDVQVSLWSVNVREQADVTIENSKLSRLDLQFQGAGGQLSARPGYYKQWSSSDMNVQGVMYNVTLVNTTISDLWGLIVSGGSNLTVSDSVVYFYLPQGSSNITVENSTITWLGADDYVGDFIFDQAEMRGGMCLNSSIFTFRGTVIFPDVRVECWSQTTVVRDYGVLVTDGNDQPLAGASVELSAPNGQRVFGSGVDAQGRTRFRLTFNDHNYQDEWTLKATLPDGEVITRSVGFLTDSPIEIWPVRRASELPDTLVVGTLKNPTSLDPHAKGTPPLKSSVEIVPNIYEALIAFKDNNTYRFVPALSTEVPSIENKLITIEDDGGMTVTFPIRQGVRFHNGDLLTPDDVAYSVLRRILHGPGFMFILATTGAISLDQLIEENGDVGACQMLQEAIKAQGDRISIHTPQPFSTLLNELTQAWIVDKSWVVKHGGWDGDCQTWMHYRYSSPDASPLSEIANGTGPFVLQRWRPGRELVLVRNDNYWCEPAHLSRVILRQTGDWDELMRMVIDDQIDLIGHYRPWIYSNFAPAVPNVGNAKVEASLPVLSLVGMFFTQSINMEKGNPNIGSGHLGEEGIPPDFFSDLDVREGFLYTFDYDRYIRETWQGLAEQLRGPIPRGLFGYNPEWPTYSYDPEKAIEHFKKAWGGQVWEKGFRTTVSYNQGNEHRRQAAELLKEGIESLNPRFHIELKGMP